MLTAPVILAAVLVVNHFSRRQSMKTKLVRALVMALIAASLLVSGTAYAKAGQPGGDAVATSASNQ